MTALGQMGFALKHFSRTVFKDGISEANSTERQNLDDCQKIYRDSFSHSPKFYVYLKIFIVFILK